MWKPDNQGHKEKTFIFFKGRDRQPEWRGLMAKQCLEDQKGEEVADWTVPHLHADKLEVTTGELDRAHNPGSQCEGNKASKPLAVKFCGVCSSGRNTQLHRRVPWRDPESPRTYKNPPTWESAPEGHNLLMGRGGSD